MLKPPDSTLLIWLAVSASRTLELRACESKRLG